MAAQFKSNIRLREEKGFGSVSMKRLIFCGVGAVLVFMLLRLTPLASASLPLMVVIFVLLLLLSGMRGGLPLWQRLLLGWRGRLLLLAWEQPQGGWAQFASGLNIDPCQARIQGEQLFAAAQQQPWASQSGEWILFADLDEAENRRGGLRLLDPGGADDEPFA